MVEHKFPLDVAPIDLSPWLAPEDVTAITPLPGWHNSIFRVDLQPGDRLVLRVHVPEEGPEFVEPTLRIASEIANHLPMVFAPLRTRNDELMAMVAGRTATLWPYIEGVHGDASILSKATAAVSLASIHSAGDAIADGLLGIEPEPWAAMDWRANSRWSLERNEGFLIRHRDRYDVGVEPEELIRRLRSVCEETAEALSHIDSHEMLTVPIHGDFYPNNLLVGPDGSIVAILDWDEARVDWRMWDLANALLEFCASPAGMNLNTECARTFIASYESMTRVLTRTERESLPLLVRARKLDEFMYGIAETFGGAVEDWEYLNWSCKGWLHMQCIKRI